MILSMLIENESRSDGFEKEHGISLLIDFNGRKLLFDTGASGAFIENAFKMGIDIRDVDKVIISHAHSDHSGGLPRFLGINNHAPVYISDKSTKEYYVNLLIKKEDVSTPGTVFRNYPDRIHFVKDFMKMDEDIFLVTSFLHKYPLTRSNSKLLVKSNGTFHRDEFDHEIALVMNNAGKLVIITGCSHNGVENMVEAVMGLFPGAPVQTVIGGFHLIGFPFHKMMGERRSNIESIGLRLMDYGVEKTYTCHCSGEWGYSVLKKTMRDRVDYFSGGMQVKI